MVAPTSSVRQLVTILSTAPCESVLALLHDPYHLASQSPVFESIVPDEGSSEDSIPGSEIASDEQQPSQTQWYRVTDRVPVIGSLQTSVTVQMKIAPADDGVETEVQAGFGVSLRTKYTVKSRSGEGEARLATEKRREGGATRTKRPDPEIRNSEWRAHPLLRSYLLARAFLFRPQGACVVAR
ncbi:hypothetical protein NMY22_g19051 [Coprinellus aureogranulatus]|nr:hypothetical protein NMY22_g19051 [Coprinellus aureogranulatus]